MSWSKEVAPLKGHERLTMADQMRAAAVPTAPHTSPTDGSVSNPRREYLKKRIAYHSKFQHPHSGSSTGSLVVDDPA